MKPKDCTSTKGDKIIVFGGTDTGAAFELDPSCAGSTSGQFLPLEVSGPEETDGCVLAFYPYDEGLKVSYKEKNAAIAEGIRFPAEQKYLSGSFAEESFPMVSIASSGSDELSFRNLGGVLKLSVTGSAAVSGITVEGNDGELLSGCASVLLGMSADPILSMNSDAAQKVSLVCNPSVRLSEAHPTLFYISLPPVEFRSGFKVTFHVEGAEDIVKQTRMRNVVKRSAILSMPTFALMNNDERCVDLGLTVKWATCNVGASRPEEYGDYFSWGEVEPKSGYTKGNYSYYDPESRSYADIGSDISGTEYDAAAVKWGNGWRMPTALEMEELATECIWTADTLGGVGGNKVEGPNGNSIFIPNNGYWHDTAKYFDNNYIEGCFGYCWAGTRSPDSNDDAYILNSENGHGVVNYRYWNRRFGLAIRPVRD